MAKTVVQRANRKSFEIVLLHLYFLWKALSYYYDRQTPRKKLLQIDRFINTKQGEIFSYQIIDGSNLFLAE